MQRSDVVLTVDGVAVDDPDGLGYRLATRPLGGMVSLTVQRGGRKMTVPLKLSLAAETPKRDLVKIGGLSPFTGGSVVNLSPAVAEEFSIDPSLEGVVLSDVEEGSPAAQVGFQRGDVFLTVNAEPTITTRKFESVVQSRRGLWRVNISRGGEVVSLLFGG